MTFHPVRLFLIVHRNKDISMSIQHLDSDARQIFKDKKFLDPTLTAHPDMIVKIESWKTIEKILYDSIESFSHLVITGITGCGKTTAILHCLRKDRVPFNKTKFLYINGTSFNTEWKIMTEISTQLGLPHGTAFTDILYKNLVTYLISTKETLVLVLDEADQIKTEYLDRFYYNIIACSSEARDHQITSGICLVNIGNDIGFVNKLDDRTQSRLLRTPPVFFDKPVLNDIEEILQVRSKVAIRDGCASFSIYNQCAAYALNKRKSVRYAIDLLRISGEIAEKNNSHIILESHVKEAKNFVEVQQIMKVVPFLPQQSKIIIAAYVKGINSKDSTEMESSELYGYYSDITDRFGVNLISRRQFDNLTESLTKANIFCKNTVSHGRYGRKNIISMPVCNTNTISMLESFVLNSI